MSNNCQERGFLLQNIIIRVTILQNIFVHLQNSSFYKLFFVKDEYKWWDGTSYTWTSMTKTWLVHVLYEIETGVLKWSMKWKSPNLNQPGVHRSQDTVWCLAGWVHKQINCCFFSMSVYLIETWKKNFRIPVDNNHKNHQEPLARLLGFFYGTKKGHIQTDLLRSPALQEYIRSLNYYRKEAPENERMSPKKWDYFNRKYIFQPLVFRGHVSFWGSNSLGFLRLLWFWMNFLGPILEFWMSIFEDFGWMESLLWI